MIEEMAGGWEKRGVRKCTRSWCVGWTWVLGRSNLTHTGGGERLGVPPTAEISELREGAGEASNME